LIDLSHLIEISDLNHLIEIKH